jgi:hypothetical protein
MKVTIEDGGYGWSVARWAVNMAEVFEEAHAERDSGQRNCVIYTSSEPTEPMLIVWWTAKRDITVRVEAQPEVDDGPEM